MDRAIVGFHQDPQGNWVAELACGHDQHLYHRPPFQVRSWVLTAGGRSSRLETPLDCPLCDRAELPGGLRPRGRSPEWDAPSLPAGLRREHRLAAGVWGLLVVREGRLVFRARVTPPFERVLEAGTAQPIPPGVEHAVTPDDDARVFIEFFGVVPYDARPRPGARPRVGPPCAAPGAAPP